nr:cyclophilin-like fold protein [Variovorax boronicumulans]
MKIHLECDGRVLTATLADTQAARALVAMLPLSTTLFDLFGRERFGALPQTLGAAELQSRMCEAGTLIAWSTGPDLAVLYRTPARPLTGRFHRLGRIDQGPEALAQAFDRSGPVDVRVTLAGREGRHARSAAARALVCTGPSMRATSQDGAGQLGCRAGLAFEPPAGRTDQGGGFLSS